MKRFNKQHLELSIVTLIITGTIWGATQGAIFVYHLSPLGYPFGGKFLYLVYFIGMYILICSGIGLLVGLLPTKFLKKLVLVVGLPVIIFMTLFLLSGWKPVFSYYPRFIQELFYWYPRFIQNLFSTTLYAILFSSLGISAYLFLKKRIAISNSVRRPFLLLPVISFLFCLSFYWFYTQEYKIEGNSAFATELNETSARLQPGALVQEGIVNNRNMILIVIDTLRADHLSCYGYQRLTSPNIDDFAKQGVLFTNAIVQKTKTSPSMASILTGTYPYTHGISDCGEMLYEEAITIGEVLKKHNYRTASVISNGNLGYELNFDQGFDDVFEVWKLSSTIAENVNKYAIQWLEENYQDKFFLYIHYIDPHSKYTPPSPYNEMFINDKLYGKLKDIKIEIRSGTYWNSIHQENVLLEGPNQTDLDFYVSQYDGEIRYCDEYVGQLLSKIKELGLDQNTLIMLTADHGEDLGKHDVYFNHGQLAYEPCARVPFIISFPPIVNPKVVDNVVETIDIFPTILDFLGIEQIDSLQGDSLLPILSSEDIENINFKKFGFVEGHYGRRIITAIRTKDWKLIYKPYFLSGSGSGDALDLASIYFPSFIWNSWLYLRAVGMDDLKNYNMMYELYNIKNDPDEQNNLYFKRHEIATPLRKKLMAWLKEHPRLFVRDIIGESKGKKLEKETLENLKALGYI